MVLRGAELVPLLGQDFALESGGSVVLFHGGRPAYPCAWMDAMLARGHAGPWRNPLPGGVQGFPAPRPGGTGQPGSPGPWAGRGPGTAQAGPAAIGVMAARAWFERVRW